MEQPVNLPCNITQVELFVKRDDLIHSYISGNKIRKLKYNIQNAMNTNSVGIITYGGAFSNHLVASAAAGKELGIKLVGRVRGEELSVQSNPVLQQCDGLDMKLEFLTRAEFTSQKHRSGISDEQGELYWVIPEGGANLEGVKGCTEIISELNQLYDYYVVAQGTCTTSLGLLLTLPENANLIVVPVLKGFDVLQEMRNVLKNDALFDSLQSKLIIWDTYHHGGYAKTSESLSTFMDEFHTINDFHIEPVYTGKVFYALNNEISLGNPIFAGKKVIIIHTGGINLR
jgi:1-aminocyclopropane-1-carboxylate deaminase